MVPRAVTAKTQQVRAAEGTATLHPLGEIVLSFLIGRRRDRAEARGRGSSSSIALLPPRTGCKVFSV